jgi:hypothetical protein
MRQSPSNPPMAPEDETSTFHLENVNLRRLTVADKVAGAASLVLLISLFLPWYTVSVPGASDTLSGAGIHRFLWLSVLLSVVVLTYLIVHATVGWDSTPMNRLSREPVLLSLSVVQLVLVIIPFFDVPDTLIRNVTVGFAYGAYVGLVAAIAALVMVLVPYVRSLLSGR